MKEFSLVWRSGLIISREIVSAKSLCSRSRWGRWQRGFPPHTDTIRTTMIRRTTPCGSSSSGSYVVGTRGAYLHRFDFRVAMSILRSDHEDF